VMHNMRMNLIGSYWSSKVLCNTWDWTSLVKQACLNFC